MTAPDLLDLCIASWVYARRPYGAAPGASADAAPLLPSQVAARVGANHLVGPSVGYTVPVQLLSSPSARRPFERPALGRAPRAISHAVRVRVSSDPFPETTIVFVVARLPLPWGLRRRHPSRKGSVTLE